MHHGKRRGTDSTLTLSSLHKEEESPYHLALKTRGAKFCEFLQEVEFNMWELKNQQSQALGQLLGEQEETESSYLKR